MSADNHGNTPAAWTGVAIGMLAFVVAGIGLMMTPISLLVFWIGLALLPVALIVWQVMERMGLGAERAPRHREGRAAPHGEPRHEVS